MKSSMSADDCKPLHLSIGRRAAAAGIDEPTLLAQFRPNQLCSDPRKGAGARLDNEPVAPRRRASPKVE